MEDSGRKRKDQALDGLPASDGKRRRVAARIEEAVECAMDAGDVGMIMGVQE